MPQPAPITIVNVGYLSTNYWVVSEGETDIAAANWRLLRERGATCVYSGHGPVRAMYIGPIGWAVWR